MSRVKPCAFRVSSTLSKKKTVKDNNNPDKEHEDRDPVDPMHRPDITVGRRIRIPLFNIEIFGYLAEHAHSKGICDKDIQQRPAPDCSECIYLLLFSGD